MINYAEHRNMHENAEEFFEILLQPMTCHIINYTVTAALGFCPRITIPVHTFSLPR